MKTYHNIREMRIFVFLDCYNVTQKYLYDISYQHFYKQSEPRFHFRNCEYCFGNYFQTVPFKPTKCFPKYIFP